MTERMQLVNFLDRLLLANVECTDSSNNGLQVEGAADVQRVIVGVDACAQLFHEAKQAAADFIIVHHGLSWSDSLRYVTNLNASRLRLLMKADISLYAVHLPLDAHPEIGNNAVLAEKLGLVDRTWFSEYGGIKIGVHGILPEAVPLEKLINQVEAKLQAQCQVLPFGPVRIGRVGVVSGGGADAIEECTELGLDCLITGEFGHVHYHRAKEAGIHVIAAGHYQTEIWGVQAVMERIRREFDLDCRFVDLPTGY